MLNSEQFTTAMKRARIRQEQIKKAFSALQQNNINELDEIIHETNRLLFEWKGKQLKISF